MYSFLANETIFLLSTSQIAAQNCRRRKMEQITELEEEVAAFDTFDRVSLSVWTRNNQL